MLLMKRGFLSRSEEKTHDDKLQQKQRIKFFPRASPEKCETVFG